MLALLRSFPPLAAEGGGTDLRAGNGVADGAPGGAAPGQQASQTCCLRRVRLGAGLANPSPRRTAGPIARLPPKGSRKPLAPPGAPFDKAERSRMKFVETQNLIDAIDRAIKAEEASPAAAS